MDRDAYNRALEDGSLQGIAEQSFYNNMAAYAEWIGSIALDPNAMTEDIDATIVTPLRDGQALLTDNPYLTRLFTTLSANEMTVDRMFDYNPNPPEVPATRRATARCECPEGVPTDSVKIKDKVIVITLADGREIRVTPDPNPVPFPFESLRLTSATLVQRLSTSGQAETIRTLTAINSGFNDDGETTVDDRPDFLSVYSKAAPRYDLDGDGIIGFGDFLRFAEALTESPRSQAPAWERKTYPCVGTTFIPGSSVRSPHALSRSLQSNSVSRWRDSTARLTISPGSSCRSTSCSRFCPIRYTEYLY